MSDLEVVQNSLLSEQIISQIQKVKQDFDQSTENSLKECEKSQFSSPSQVINFIKRDNYSDLLSQENFIQLDYLEPSSIAALEYKDESCLKVRQQRIIKEVSLMRKNLPIYETNSIFVRGSEKDQNHQKAIITGSEDTPYAFGCFLFNIRYPEQFPNVPPNMQILTVGDGILRFNPNLYNCGYVCLSLLGTWSGQDGENWDPAVSTVMHVLMSIQSIVMCEDVYFQEPGYECYAGQQPYNQYNRGYQNIVKYGTVKFAMNEMIQKPSQGFEDSIRMHFYLNKNKILDNVQKWLDEEKNLIQDNNYNFAQQYQDNTLYHNPELCATFSQSKEAFYQHLEKEVKILKELLDTLTYRKMYQIPLFREFHIKINQGNKLNNSIITPEETPKIQIAGIRKIAQQKKLKKKQKLSKW